jgi:LysR family hydrogen peroxide-inducible transcriptional activator
MNIRDFKYLVAIADHCHFGKAADACFVSQPALSMQIKKLESSLGVKLIERNNKLTFLTEIGKMIATQARDLLQQVDAIKEIAKLASDPFRGECHLGIIPTLAPYLLPHIIPGITQKWPNLKIYLTEEQTGNLVTKLKQGRLDAALLGLPIIDDDFDSLPLFKEELKLALPEDHPLANRKQIRNTDLEEKALLLLEDGHCLRDQILALCQSVNAFADKSFQATSLETLRYMVASKVGITLMPNLSCRQDNGICYVPFSSPQPARTIGIIWRASSTKKVLFENLIDHIRHLLSSLSTVKVMKTPLRCLNK